MFVPRTARQSSNSTSAKAACGPVFIGMASAQAFFSKQLADRRAIRQLWGRCCTYTVRRRHLPRASSDSEDPIRNIEGGSGTVDTEVMVLNI